MLNKVIGILSEFSEVPAESISGDSRLEGDLGLTSLDVVGIVGRIEEEFDVNIDESLDVDFQTVNDIVEFIKHNSAAPSDGN